MLINGKPKMKELKTFGMDSLILRWSITQVYGISMCTDLPEQSLSLEVVENLLNRFMLMCIELFI